ncbi:MAG: M48 family metallopeptidase [Candidatus Omnitrophota bacterium]
MDDRIKKYSRIKYALAMAGFVYLLLILALFQFSGLAAGVRIWISSVFANQFLLIFFYCLILFSLYFILNFPLEFYCSYAVEHRFGLSRQKFFHWFGDRVKELIVGFIIFIILAEGFFFFLRHYPDDWWWLSGLFWIFFSVVLARVFPVLIIPLFFKYKRVTDEELRRRILNLAGRMGIKILDVYQVDFSKKTAKANAAMVGLGKSKRVILADTLLGNFSPEEIEVILAHEFAHFRLGHLIKMLILNAILILFVFYVLFRISGPVFNRLDLSLTDVAGLGIWLFCFALIQACLVPFLNWVSRRMERNADYLAIKFSRLIEDFISTMDKLSRQNLAERNPARWIKIIFFDHPPVEERIALAKNFREE